MIASSTSEELSNPRTQRAARGLLTYFALRLGLFAALYTGLFALYLRFPYLQAGADLVTERKHELARTGQPFQQLGARHVAVFGDSRVLSAFIPAQFDREVAGALGTATESFNFGLPGDSRFVRDLESMIQRGVVPDVVLLTDPWPEMPEPSPALFRFLDNDQEILTQLFPFRRLPRDFFILAVTAGRSPSKFRAAYANNERSLQQVMADRGYYFLARMSHYQGDALPPDLRLQTDTPSVIKHRDVPVRGGVYQRLCFLFAAHRIRCILIPTYFRDLEFAAPPRVNPATAAALAGSPQFAVQGPDYYLFPNSYFSDPRHLNHRGAQQYTHLIADLVAREVAAPRP